MGHAAHPKRHRCRGWIPPGHADAYSRPRSTLQPQCAGHTRGRGRGPRAAPRTLAQPERVRGTLRAHHQGILPRSPGSHRRGITAASGPRVRRTLSPRTASSRTYTKTFERAHRTYGAGAHNARTRGRPCWKATQALRLPLPSIPSHPRCGEPVQAGLGRLFTRQALSPGHGRACECQTPTPPASRHRRTVRAPLRAPQRNIRRPGPCDSGAACRPSDLRGRRIR